jgi:hypothetical protein
MRGKRIEHKEYIREFGDDMPEVRDLEVAVLMNCLDGGECRLEANTMRMSRRMKSRQSKGERTLATESRNRIAVPRFR